MPQERCYWLRLVTLLPEVIARAAELGPGRFSHRGDRGCGGCLPGGTRARGVIQELVAVVSVELTQREGEALADLVDGRADPRHAMGPRSPDTRPARRHIDRDEPGEVEARPRCSLPAVEHEIRLQGARADVGPLAEGAERDVRAQRRGRGAEEVRLAPARGDRRRGGGAWCSSRIADLR